MHNPPELPPLKPMETQSPPPQSAPSPAAAAPRGSSGGTGTRRLRQIVAFITGGGLAMVFLVLFFQLVAKPGLRPTDLMAQIEAQTDLGIMNQKMGAKPGEVLMTEADYKAKLAEAKRGGQAKAELAFQEQLAVVQADKERVVGAYQTLYQRANLIAQAGVQMEAQALGFRQQLITMTNGGRVAVLTVEDGLCAMGSEDACEAARKLRAGMIEESTTLTEGKMAEKARELMDGIDDPASFITDEDQRRNGTPALRR